MQQGTVLSRPKAHPPESRRAPTHQGPTPDPPRERLTGREKPVQPTKPRLQPTAVVVVLCKLRQSHSRPSPKERQPQQGHNPADQPPKRSVAEWGVRTLRQACCQEIPGSAMCVQNFDDSRGLAIRITYRISLRSSSLWEPRHPLLKVVMSLVFQGAAEGCSSAHSRFRYSGTLVYGLHLLQQGPEGPLPAARP